MKRKQDPAIEEKVEALLSQMTVEEKVGQMLQVSYNANGMTPEAYEKWKKMGLGSYLHVLGDEAEEIRELAKQTRLKIPPIFGIDAIHGHSLLNGATIFPSQLAMSCSWNPDLIYEMGRVTAKEVAADGLDWAFSPVLCIGRDLRWGRINETFGEDSYLISRLGAAIIKGYEEDGYMIACAKHYLGYGEATGGRDSYDTEVSMRKVREVFLPPFRAAAEVGCSSVMTAYGSLDSTPLTCHKEALRDLLKGEAGFDGFVVTDWENVRSLVKQQMVAKDMDEACKMTIDAGNDMSMNTPEFYDATVRLVKEGKIATEYIDDAVRRILRVKFRLGLFDENRQLPDKSVIACDAHKKLNLELTRETLVLLKNDGTLPLQKQPKKIAVIGPNADNLRNQYGDWTFFTHPGFKPDVVPLTDYYTILGGMKKVYADSEVVYARGCDTKNKADKDITAAIDVAKDCDLIVVAVGDDYEQNGEMKDRADLTISGAQTELVTALKALGKPLVTVLVNGKPLVFGEIAQASNAVIETFNGGDAVGIAVAELIRGDFSPSGRLSISFPYSSCALPCYYNQYSGWHGGKYMDMPEGNAYVFGYGLSYTEFEYSNLKTDKTTYQKDDTVTVTVDVKNNGAMDAKEVVQLYIHDTVSTILTPVKQLKGFEKVKIKAGETKTVTLSLPVSDLGFYKEDGFVIEAGEFEIMVGKNSAEHLTTTITVE